MLATPLVISVHSIVSWDFAVSLLPGWHSTIFPPYFVAGAIHSGLAMALTLLIPMRKFINLKELITKKHLEAIAKFIVFTGSIITYAYVIEPLIEIYTDSTVHIQFTGIQDAGLDFMGILHHPVFECGGAVFTFGEQSQEKYKISVCCFIAYKYGNVARALFYSGEFHCTRFYATQLGQVCTHMGGAEHYRRHCSFLFIYVYGFCQISSYHFNCRF